MYKIHAHMSYDADESLVTKDALDEALERIARNRDYRGVGVFLIVKDHDRLIPSKCQTFDRSDEVSDLDTLLALCSGNTHIGYSLPEGEFCLDHHPSTVNGEDFFELLGNGDIQEIFNETYNVHDRCRICGRNLVERCLVEYKESQR